MSLRFCARLGAGIALLLFASHVQATGFSVLLQGQSGGECDLQPDGGGGAYRPLSILVNLPADAVQTPKVLTFTYDVALPGGVPTPSEGFVFGLTLEDASTGELTTTFSQPVEIQLELLIGEATLPEGKVLSYLDETQSPPVWVTQDGALTNKKGKDDRTNYVCGTTTHFTWFYMGPASAVPEPGSALLAMGAAGVFTCRRWRRKL